MYLQGTLPHGRAFLHMLLCNGMMFLLKLLHDSFVAALLFKVPADGFGIPVWISNR